MDPVGNVLCATALGALQGLDMTERKYLRVLSEGLETTDPGSVNRICMISCPEDDL